MSFCPLHNAVGLPNRTSMARTGSDDFLIAWHSRGRNTHHAEISNVVLHYVAGRPLKTSKYFEDKDAETADAIKAAQEALSPRTPALGPHPVSPAPASAASGTPDREPAKPDPSCCRSDLSFTESQLPTVRGWFIGEHFLSDPIASKGGEALMQFMERMDRAVVVQYAYEILGISCRIGRSDGAGLTQLPFPGNRGPMILPKFNRQHASRMFEYSLDGVNFQTSIEGFAAVVQEARDSNLGVPSRRYFPISPDTVDARAPDLAGRSSQSVFIFSSNVDSMRRLYIELFNAGVLAYPFEHGLPTFDDARDFVDKYPHGYTAHEDSYITSLAAGILELQQNHLLNHAWFHSVTNFLFPSIVEIVSRGIDVFSVLLNECYACWREAAAREPRIVDFDLPNLVVLESTNVAKDLRQSLNATIDWWMVSVFGHSPQVARFVKRISGVGHEIARRLNNIDILSPDSFSYKEMITNPDGSKIHMKKTLYSAPPFRMERWW